MLGGRLLIADNDGDELWEIDPDGSDSQGTLLRDLPTNLTSPFRNDGTRRQATNRRLHRRRAMGDRPRRV